MLWGRIIGAGVAAAILGVGAGSMLGAQTPLDQQRSRLQAAKRDAAAAEARSKRLEAQARAERNRAARAKAEELAVAERINVAQANIRAAQARIAILQRLMQRQRTVLAERQGPVMRLIAALQSMARRPAAASLVQPGSVRDMVHVRAMLGTIMPVIQQRTAAVRADIQRSRTLRQQAGLAVASLREGRAKLEDERTVLTKLEAEHRLRSADLGRSAMLESDRALALGEQARDLVATMEETRENRATEAGLAALPGPLPRPDSDDDTPPTKGGAGNAPYILPLHGQVDIGFGEISKSGVRSRGITLTAWGGAKIVAPAAGRVTYAGPFKSYGAIVIIDHGGGWTSLITGMASTGLRAGQQVAQGAAIGRAAEGADSRVTVELRRKDQPVDLVALLGKG